MSALPNAAVPPADAEAPVALGWSRADVSAVAEELAKQWGYRAGEALEPLVARLGGTIGFIDLSENESNYGAIVVESDGSFVISLPQDSGPLRDRFTIAHELGHYALHFFYQRDINRRPIERLRANRFGSDKAEWEANWFAAAFLMPGNAFREAWKTFNHDLLAIADKFKVSQSAASVRAQSLNLVPRV
ncbi:MULTISPECIES: ImmA/IrrE family metallo-endopeptidase [Luteibacter]|uniref:ImmA/IrrE family metallo-endopeptidase n=1 Tax=Luteibacter TaxID=242605 RepID=UPI000566F188|nr:MULTISPECIES: ImmA/IrrE family metallo-endopeptidase [unclassified Luteibacter]